MARPDRNCDDAMVGSQLVGASVLGLVIGLFLWGLGAFLLRTTGPLPPGEPWGFLRGASTTAGVTRQIGRWTSVVAVSGIALGFLVILF
jgi:hypothetical protein